MKGIFLILKKQLPSFLTLFFLLGIGMVFFLTAYGLRQDLGQTLTDFYESHQLAELELSSQLGLSRTDLEALGGTGVRTEGYYQITLPSGLRILSYEDRINRPLLLEGRLPERPGECAVGWAAGERLKLLIGSSLDFSGIEDLPLKEKALIVVGVVARPESLKREESDFILIRSDALTEEDLYTHAFFRTDMVQDDYFSGAFEARSSALEEEVAGRAAAVAQERLSAMEEAYFQEQMEAFSGINQESQALVRREASLSQRQTQWEEEIRQLEEENQSAQEALTKAEEARTEAQEGFQEQLDELEELRTAFMETQQIGAVIQGNLPVAENQLNDPGLRSMLPAFRSRAAQILEAFTRADIYDASYMERALETARQGWDADWRVFRTGLSAEERASLEKATGRSLVATGIALSNELKSYGSLLQTAGIEDRTLQESIRNLMGEQSAAGLPNLVSRELSRLQQALSERENEYMEIAVQLAELDEDYESCQKEWQQTDRLLRQARADYDKWQQTEQADLNAAREEVESRRQAAEALYDEKKAELDRKREQPFSLRSVFDAHSSLKDQQQLLKLLNRMTYIALGALGLLCLFYSAAFMSRVSKENEEGLPAGEWGRISRRSAMIKTSFDLCLAALLALAAAAALSLLLTKIAGPWLLKTYQLSPEGQFHGRAALICLGCIFLGLGLGLLLWGLMGSFRQGSPLRALCLGAFAAWCAALLGLGLWLISGLLKSGGLGETLPSLALLLRLAAGFVLAWGLVGLFTLPREAEKLNAAVNRPALYLARVNGAPTRLIRRMLLKGDFLPAFLGTCIGGAGALLLSGILGLDKMGEEMIWQTHSQVVIWLLAVFVSLILILVIPAGIRRQAGRSALYQDKEQ